MKKQINHGEVYFDRERDFRTDQFSDLLKIGISQNGRTILFVSHTMTTIQSLCTHGILLKNGTIYNTTEKNRTNTKEMEPLIMIEPEWLYFMDGDDATDENERASPAGP
jgi:ABC-type sugar transport system ATPase subunit